MVTKDSKDVHLLMKSYENLDDGRYDPLEGHEYQSFVEALEIFQQKYDHFMTDREFEEGCLSFHKLLLIFSKVESRISEQKLVRKYNSLTKKWDNSENEIGE